MKKFMGDLKGFFINLVKEGELWVFLGIMAFILVLVWIQGHALDSRQTRIYGTSIVVGVALFYLIGSYISYKKRFPNGKN